MAEMSPLRPGEGTYLKDDFLGNEQVGDHLIGELLWEIAAIANASTLSLPTAQPHGVLRLTTANTADGDGEVLFSLPDGIVLNGGPGFVATRVRFPAIAGNTVEDNNFRIGLDASVAATVYPSIGTAAATASSDLVTLASHGLTLNDRLTCLSSDAAGIAAGDNLWPITITTDTFQVSTTRGGAVLNITGDGTALELMKLYEGITGPTDGLWIESDGGVLSLQAHSNDHGDNFKAVNDVPALADLPTSKVAAATAGGDPADIITLASHGLNNGEQIVIVASDATGLAANTRYFVRDSTGSTFRVALTPDGAVVDITGDGTAVTWKKVPGDGTTMILGEWVDLELRWSDVNAEGGPQWAELYVNGVLGARQQVYLDNDESMELKIAHWQDTGAAGTLELDIDYFEVFLPRV
jgi:hypothetical protein